MLKVIATQLETVRIIIPTDLKGPCYDEQGQLSCFLPDVVVLDNQTQDVFTLDFDMSIIPQKGLIHWAWLNTETQFFADLNMHALMSDRLLELLRNPRPCPTFNCWDLVRWVYGVYDTNDRGLHSNNWAVEPATFNRHQLEPMTPVMFRGEGGGNDNHYALYLKHGYFFNLMGEMPGNFAVQKFRETLRVYPSKSVHVLRFLPDLHAARVGLPTQFYREQ